MRLDPGSLLSSQVTPRILLRLLADPDRAKVKRAMEAMMEMVKIDVAAIEAPTEGPER